MKESSRLLVLALACGAGVLFAASGGPGNESGRAPLLAANHGKIEAAKGPILDSLQERESAAGSGARGERPVRLLARTRGVTVQVAAQPREQVIARGRSAGALISALAVFEPNDGQAAPGAQFVGRAAGMTVVLTGDGITVRVPARGAAKKPAEASRKQNTLEIRVRGNRKFFWSGQQQTEGQTNYFVGNDPKKWRTHVPNFKRVETIGAQAVGLSVYASADGNAQEQNETRGKGQAIEYDLRTAAGVDASKVRLELSGAQDLKIDGSGDLVMHVGGRELRMNAPAIYEQVSATSAANATNPTTTGTHKKATSSTHKRASTSTHSTPRGAHRETTPRKSQGSSGNSEKRRVRKSMKDDPPSPRKKRPRKTIPKFPPASSSPQSKPAQAKPPKSDAPPQQSGRRIDGGYVLEADGSVGLWIGRHDPRASLVIDPSLTLTYETFLGGAGADSANSIAIDSAGNVYVAGTTTSAASFPESADAINEGSEHGSAQLFIAKLAFSASGTGTLQYLTFFGGSVAQAGGQVAVDPSGNAAVLGTTNSADYPTTDGSTATQGLTSGTGNDLVVSEVDSTGANLTFSTIFGGSGAESQNAAAGIPLTTSQNIPAAEGGIAFDASGNLYVASDTTSQDLPTTAGAFRPAFGGKSKFDGFMAEFQPQDVVTGTSDLIYCSYLGTNSDGQVAIGGVAVDAVAPQPNVYLAGLTKNDVDGFPVEGALQTGYGGGTSDAFLMEISPVGGGPNDVIYATLLGGSGMDEALGVAVDTQTPANAYVVGATQSPNFPEQPVLAGPSTTLHAPYSPGAPAAQNAFLAVVAWNPATLQSYLQYFTYLGGSGIDAAQSVVAPFSNQVYVAGTATSFDFAWHDNLQPFNGVDDAFLAKLDTTESGASSLLYATPFGGTFFTPGDPVSALGNAVAADGDGHVYVAGETTAADFPTAATSTGAEINGFQQICASCQEATPQSDTFLVGIQEQATPQPALVFSKPSLSFGQGGIQIGSSGVPQPFSITNTGDAALTLSTIYPPTVTGANATDFVVVLPGCPQPLPPAGICVGEVSFTPSLTGVEGGVISIQDNAPGSPQLLEVTGTGAGSLKAAPTSFTFDPAPINAALPQKITITLTAGAEIDDLEIAPASSGMGPFQHIQLQPDCATTSSLPPASSCNIQYEFAPATTGTFQAQLDVTYEVNGAAGPAEKLQMTGTAIPPAPVASVRPSQLTFGNESVGATSGSQPVLVANIGSAPLGFTQAIGFSGPNAAEFLETDNCPSSLSAGAYCTVNVKFSPQSAGGKTANLTVTDNAPGSPQTVALAGTATAVAQIQVLPATWGFGSESVGSPSAQQIVTITNVGTLPLGFTQPITITGTNSADFTETTGCNIQAGLQPGDNCTVQLTFIPTGPGNRTATLVVSDTAPGSPQTVTLSGTGDQANASLSPPTLQFSPQFAGTPSAAQTVTVNSTGPGQPLSVTKIALTGTNAADFSETDSCGTPVTASCAIQVTFTPACSSVASRSALLSITDNGPTSPQTVQISGQATGFCLNLPATGMTQSVVSGSTANFPPITVSPVGNFSGAITIACTPAPAGPICTPLPSATLSVQTGVPENFEIQVTTAAASAAPRNLWQNKWKWSMRREWRAPFWLAAFALSLAMLLLGRRSERSLAAKLGQTIALAILFAAGLAACGGGGSASTAATDPPPTLAAGSYAIAVTASEGGQSLPINLTLTVTQ